MCLQIVKIRPYRLQDSSYHNATANRQHRAGVAPGRQFRTIEP